MHSNDFFSTQLRTKSISLYVVAHTGSSTHNIDFSYGMIFFIVVYEDTLISSAMIGLLCDAGSLSRDTPLAFSPATLF